MSSVIDAKEFKTTDYEACKLHFMKLYELSEMQFDVFYYNHFAGQHACILSVQDGQLFLINAIYSKMSLLHCGIDRYKYHSNKYSIINNDALCIEKIKYIKKYDGNVLDLLTTYGQKQMLFALYKEKYGKTI